MCFKRKKLNPYQAFIDAIKNDPDMYKGYKDNIAVSIQDTIASYKKENNKKILSNNDMYIISNEAAENFLKKLTN